MSTPPSSDRGGTPLVQALRAPHFPALLLSNLLQQFGGQIQLFSLQWLVTDLTTSRTAIGLVTTVQGVVVAASSPAAGVAADRLPKRMLLLIGRLGVFAGILVMVGLTQAGWVSLWHVFAFVAAAGLVASFSQPASLTYVFDVVGRERAQPAVALNSAGIGLGQMAGPALAGVLVASIGVVGSWLSAAGALAVSALLLLVIPIRGLPLASDRAPLRELREGFAYVLATPPVLLALIACSMAFFNGALFAMRPVFARHVLEVGSEGMGWMAASAGLGNLLGALAATLMPTIRRPGMAIALSMLAFSVCIFAYAFAFSLPYLMGVEFASGLAAQVWQISAFSGLQLSVPEHMRGRVMGILFTVAQLAQVGGVFVGGVADRMGDQVAMGLFGVIPITVLLGLIAFGHRQLARLGPETAMAHDDGARW